MYVDFEAVAGVFVLRPAIELIGVEEGMVRYCMVYGTIGMITLPCYMLQFLFQILFVTAEKPRLGFWITVITGVTNIVLDFILIVLLHWGVAGAAVATGISEVFGGIAPLIYFSRPNDSLLRIGRPWVEFRALRKACTNGLSEFVSTISESVVSMLYNFQLLRLAGADGVAAFGVMQYCTFIFFAIFAGYNMGVQPLFSYNFGAENRDEMKNLFKKSMILVEGAGLMMLAALVIFARPLISIFVGYDADLVDMAVHGMRIYALMRRQHIRNRHVYGAEQRRRIRIHRNRARRHMRNRRSDDPSNLLRTERRLVLRIGRGGRIDHPCNNLRRRIAQEIRLR